MRNIFSDGYTPLHLAAISGHTDTVATLLAHQADISAKTSRGWTPLYLACAQGHLAIVLALVYCVDLERMKCQLIYVFYILSPGLQAKF